MKNNNSKKRLTMPVTILLVAILLVLGGFIYHSNQSKNVDKTVEEQSIVDNEALEQEEKDLMTNQDEATIKYSGTILAGNSAPLLDFTKADYDIAIKSDKLIVIYFYANWCPICRAEFPIMQEVFNKLDKEDTIGFRVNYNDDQTDNDEKGLAKQFGVAYQHTKVFVKNGQRILKSPEQWDKNRYNDEISKALNQ